MSNVYGSTQSNSTLLISANTYSPNDNFYYSNYSSGRKSLTLAAGKYYYMEVYHINSGGTGFMKISVEVPNTDTSLIWQTH